MENTSGQIGGWQLHYRYIESAEEYRVWFSHIIDLSSRLSASYNDAVEYDGNSHEIATLTGDVGLGRYRYKKTTDSEWTYSSLMPAVKDVGTYELEWYSAGLTAIYLPVGSETDWQTTGGTKFAITKATATTTKAPVANTDLIYNGQEQALVTAGRTNGGTILYSTTSATSGFSSELPKATNAGTYTVWYKIQGDANHNDSEAVEISGITIVPKTVGLNWDDEPLYYTGSPQVPGCTATGLVSDDECTVTVEGARTAVGTGYTATATALSNSNYALPENVTATFSIDKTSPIVTAPTAFQPVYNKTEQDIVTAGEAAAGCTITYSTSEDGVYTGDIPKGTDAGNYTVWYKVTGGGLMTDWGAHMFDIAQWALGKDLTGPVEIIPPGYSYYEHLTYRYDNGVIVSEEPFDGSTPGVQIYGDEGWIKVSRGNFAASDKKFDMAMAAGDDSVPYETKVGHHRAFIEAMKSRIDPNVPVEVGHSSCTVCNLGNIAMELGRPVIWNPIVQKFMHDPEATKLLHYDYRPGYSLDV